MQLALVAGEPGEQAAMGEDTGDQQIPEGVYATGGEQQQAALGPTGLLLDKLAEEGKKEDGQLRI